MRKLAIALLIVIASAAFADKGKSKSKEKSFEPVVPAAAGYVGSYRGPSEAHGLILDAAADGKLRGHYVELGRVAVLGAIEVHGSELTARASFDDGSWKTIRGSFAKRVLNGNAAFGLRVNNVLVDGLGPVDTFFERID